MTTAAAHTLRIATLLTCYVATILAQGFDEPLNSQDQVKRWIFSDGREFPGATGSLVFAQGPRGGSAALNFQFTCDQKGNCGRYVEAVRNLKVPVRRTDGAVLTFRVSMPPNLSLTVRLTDETGQTLQYHLEVCTLEEPDAETWHEAFLPLWTDKAAPTHWGGHDSGLIEGSITRIAILADSRSRTAADGQMKFAEIKIGPNLAKVANITPDIREALSPNLADHLAPQRGISIHSTDDDRSLDTVAGAGFSFVRADIYWQDLEQHNTFDFTKFDHLVEQLRLRGLGTLWVLGYGHPDHGGKYPRSKDDLEAFGRYATAIAEHYRSPDIRFEIWNEPDLSLTDPKIFALILKAGANAIRRTNAKAEISSGGIAALNPGFLALPFSSGAFDNVNAIGVHPYRSVPETVASELLNFRRGVSRFSDKPPQTWGTEWGYSTYSEETKARHGNGHSPEAQARQSILAVREILSAWASGLPMIVWYDLIDDNNNPFDTEGNYGILNPDKSAKPAFYLLRTLSQQVKNYAYLGMLSGLPPGTHGLSLGTDARRLFVIWVDNPDRPANLRIAEKEGLTLADASGNGIDMTHKPGGTALFRLTEDMGPIYVGYNK